MGWENPFIWNLFVEFIHWNSDVTVMLTEEYSRKNATSPVILLQPYHKLDVNVYPLRKNLKLFIPQLDSQYKNKVNLSILR